MSNITADWNIRMVETSVSVRLTKTHEDLEMQDTRRTIETDEDTVRELQL